MKKKPQHIHKTSRAQRNKGKVKREKGSNALKMHLRPFPIINHPNQAAILNPRGANMRSRATLFATALPFSREMAPITAYIVWARTRSIPELSRLLGYT